MLRVARLFISPGHNFFGRHGMTAGENEAVEVEEIECVSGRGIRGDRFFDFKPDYKGQITFFDLAVFRELLATLGLPADTCPSLVRRNAFTEGLDLNTLIGKEFTVQGVRFLGVAECSPCHWMDSALAPGAEEFLKGRGGLRCKILSDGVLLVEGEADHEVGASHRDARAGTPNDTGRLGDAPLPIKSSFSGLVLAGGNSSRMGEDKAFLEIAGEPLIVRQPRLLREAGCERVVISGRRGVDYPGNAAALSRSNSATTSKDERLRAAALPAVVHDAPGASGPLAGILAAIDSLDASTTHLVTLPVDLPAMRPEILRSLIAACSPGYGVVASSSHGVEPLVAVLPREIFPALRDAVAAGALSPKSLYALPVFAARLRVLAPHPPDDDAFINWNRREDWIPLPAASPPAPAG